MYPANFDYYRPKNLKEAITLLRKKKDAKLLAGGHSLLPAMKLRVSSPNALIDIGHIKGLDNIKVGKSAIRIGGLSTHFAIESSKAIRKNCSILSDAASIIGDMQVRNRGTIGGSLAHADPAADYPTVILALDAKIGASGPTGKRQIPAEKFFRDIFTTALRRSEILTDVRVPFFKPGQGGAYLKHRHPASSYAVVGVAAVIHINNDAVNQARIAIGGVTVNPFLITAAADGLIGKKPTVQAIAEVAAKVPDAIKDPLSDLYASGEYRRHLAGVLVRRAISEAVKRAKKRR